MRVKLPEFGEGLATAGTTIFLAGTGLPRLRPMRAALGMTVEEKTPVDPAL